MMNSWGLRGPERGAAAAAAAAASALVRVGSAVRSPLVVSAGKSSASSMTHLYQARASRDALVLLGRHDMLGDGGAIAGVVVGMVVAFLRKSCRPASCHVRLGCVALALADLDSTSDVVKDAPDRTPQVCRGPHGGCAPQPASVPSSYDLDIVDPDDKRGQRELEYLEQAPELGSEGRRERVRARPIEAMPTAPRS